MISHPGSPALRAVRPLLAVAVLVSIVHYGDNYVSYGAYPEPTSGPAPSRATVGISWFVFTAFAVAAYALLAARRTATAALALAAYSLSGLIGIGHYLVPGATGMPWWRQLHIVADIACGVAILACAVWLVRRGPAAGQRAAA